MRLLYVCAGNVCRSPYARYRSVAELGPDTDLEISSAGTRARPGQPVDQHTASLLSEHRIVADDHRSRRLTAADVDHADLVLTMSAGERSAVLEVAPGALRRTFMLSEAMTLAQMIDDPGRVAATDPQSGLRGMVQDMAAARARLRRPHPGFPDVVDPIGRSLGVHRDAAKAIESALEVLLPRLAPVVRR